MSSILDKLPSLVKVSQEDVKSSNAPQEKQFIVVFEKKHTPEHEALLTHYGKVLAYDSSFINIPLNQHNFDYLLIDINDKQHRNLLMKEDLNNYNVVVVCSIWSEEEDFISDINAINILHSLPPKQAFKADFDRLLLSKKIRKPNCAKTILRIFLKALAGWQ